jgi:hypothetical protein
MIEISGVPPARQMSKSSVIIILLLMLYSLKKQVDTQSTFGYVLVLAVDSIRVLDVSYNALGGSGLLGFLGRLCATEIVSLNLGATTAGDGLSVAQEVILMFAEREEFNKLTTLSLSDCRLRDEDIWHLLRCVDYAFW